MTPSDLYPTRPSPTDYPPTVSRTQSPTEPWMTIGTPTGKMPVIPHTGTPIPARDRTQTLPPLELTPAPEVIIDPLAEASAAFHRGKSALRMEDLQTAVRELSYATQLNPAEVDYAAVRAWAVFCCSTDKSNVIEETRKTLAKAILKSSHPEIARFYLGRVERMLGRDKEALRHFNEVLELQPRHPEAASEKRIIELRLAAANDKSGLFRKR
ncbi:MAG: tetratricopeptide repeat protein [Kofleriaceae bacterium]